MQYSDRIYGTIEIDEPVITELVESAPLQRLKEINQYGAAFFRFPHLTTTRYEHSVGVYYILKKLNAPIIEQIAGLLHDAPHTAFSHVSDVVFEDASQAFHDKFHEKILFSSNIPRILKRHGFSVWKLLNKSSFHLAESDLPDLCADRIDYFFRDCVTDKQLDLVDARRMLDDMTTHKGEIVFKTEDIAKQFATVYRGANEKLWAHPLQAALYYLLSSAMKVALEEGVLTFDDLFTTDQEVAAKMRAAGNPEIDKFLHDMENIAVEENASSYDYHIRPKIRLVDPYVLVGEGDDARHERLSELDSGFRDANARFIEEKSKGYYIKVLNT
jgi:HD superfamily phosphohydrolase